MRNLAKIPDMISVTHGKVDYLFDDTSHFVENPEEYYAPHTGIDDWKDDEKAILLDKYAAFPKQFGIIGGAGDFLPNKTPAQCVDYYYLHKHKFIDFRKVVLQMAPNKRKRRGMGKKKGNGLLVDIALHDMEVHRGAAGACYLCVCTRDACTARTEICGVAGGEESTCPAGWCAVRHPDRYAHTRARVYADSRTEAKNGGALRRQTWRRRRLRRPLQPRLVLPLP